MASKDPIDLEQPVNNLSTIADKISFMFKQKKLLNLSLNPLEAT